jgi:hypothetical protein
MATNRWQRYFFALLLVMIVLSTYFLSYCSVRNEQQLADRKIFQLDLINAVSQLEDGSVPFIDLAKIARFDWDKFYVFGPYTSDAYINSTLGIFWSLKTTIDSNDGMTLLVFTRKGKPVHYFDYGNENGDFSALLHYEDPNSPPHAEYSFQEARFALDEKGRIVWVGGK